MRWRSADAAFAVALLASTGCTPSDGLPGRIGIQTVARLGSAGSDGALSSMPASIVRDSAGHFLVAAPWGAAAELVGIYDSAGAFVGRIGGIGDGPGEYRRPGVLLRSAHDSIFIVDNEQRRMTVLAPDIRYVRSEPLATDIQDAMLGPSGQLFANAPRYRRDSVTQPVFRLGAAGDSVRAYGTAIAGCRSDCPWRLARSIAPDRQGVWLVTRFFNYSAEHWSADGRMLKRFDFGTDWFSPYDSLLMPTPDRPPQAAITGAWLDQAGHLWIVGYTFDPDWAKGLGTERTGEGGRQYFPIERQEQALDGIIEVRDTATGARLAFRRLDDAPYLLPIGQQLIGRLYADDAGWVMVDVLRLSYDISNEQ